MVNLLLFVMASIGMTNIIVDGVIFQPVRDFLRQKLPARIFKLFECYQCAGMWCGMICGAMLVSWRNPFVIFCCGLAASFLAHMTALVFNYLEARSIVEIEAE
jgi:hypothetical protein